MEGDNFGKARELVNSRSEKAIGMRKSTFLSWSSIENWRRIRDMRYANSENLEKQNERGDDLEKGLVLLLLSTSVPINVSEEF